MKNLSRLFAIIFGLFSAVHPASAMLMINELIGFQAGGSAASISFVGCTVDPANASTYTFTNHATGTAGNRWTIVVAGMTDNVGAFNFSTITVGGSSATEVADTADATSIVQSGIYIIANPSGTTATIVVTPSEAVSNMGVCVYAAYDLNSITATDTAIAFSAASASLDLSLDVSSGGVAVGVSTSDLSDSAMTWTGLTERSETVIEAASLQFSSADTSTAGVPLTVGADWTGTDHASGASASFR